MAKRTELVRTISFASLLSYIALQSEAGSISGRVLELGRPRAGAEVGLTTYAGGLCVSLVNKKDRTAGESDQLTICRKENAHTVETSAQGTFEIPDLPAGWYSVTIKWPQGNLPVWCSQPAPKDWTVKNIGTTAGGTTTFFLSASGSPFELKAADTLSKDFSWCP